MRFLRRTLISLCCALTLGLLVAPRAQAGGPLVVGGTFGLPGQPFLWSTATEVQYRTDGGNLGILSNATANQRVAGMFQVWEDVPTAAIGFNRAGGLLSTGASVDGDVSTAAEFNAVEGSCNNGQQSPIIYDVNGSLFQSLGLPAGVIGFAGPCALSSNGQIVSAEAALNGKFRDGNANNLELSDNEFDAVFIHEFGHFFGLDHSQINLNCLIGGLPVCSDFSEDAFGLPTMFPFLISGLEESPGVHPARTLSADDVAWVSRLYPTAGFNSSFGTITGTILFSDGQSPAQGVNVIARRIDNPRRFAVSVVSGFRFTGNPGQSVTGNNPGSSFGSRDPGLIGTYEVPGLEPGSYTVEVESVHPAFVSGSSVGPLDPPIPSPGPNEFFNFGESSTDNLADSSPLGISGGTTLSGINVILNGTPPRFDPFEPSDSISGTALLFNDGTAGLSVSPFADQDFYSFQAQSGTPVSMVSFALQPSRVDTVMELLGFNGIRFDSCRPLNSTGPFDQPCLNDDRQDQPDSLDSALQFLPPSSGTFFVHILDFRGDGRPDFRYSIGTQGVTNPVPVLSSISPSNAFAGQSFELTVTGSGFGPGINTTPGSRIIWGNSFLATTFVSPTVLRGAVFGSLTAGGGTFPISVLNDPPGGGTSNSLSINIVNPVPALTPFPYSMPVGFPEAVVPVYGSGFVSTSVARWNGSDRLTFRASSDLLNVTLTASDFANAGTAQLSVFNPGPGGGASNSVPFVVASPIVTQLFPDKIPAGSPGFSLLVQGLNFLRSEFFPFPPSSVVRWNGSDRPTSPPINAGSGLVATISSADIATLGSAAITVRNPGGGIGSISAPVPFTIMIRNPLPSVTSLSPTGAVGGTAGSTLTVNGSNFVFNSEVRWDGASRTTTFVSSTQLEAFLPATDLELADVGTHQVTVVNPSPGGGTSNAVSLNVVAAPNPAPMLASLMPNNQVAGSVRTSLPLTVTGSNFITGSVVRWNGMPRLTSFVDSSHLTAIIPSSDLAAAGTAQVTVFTSAPGGGTSTALPFIINNPTPTLASISPASATAGGAAFTLTVLGSSFTPGSVVRWNGTARPTTFIGSNQLRAAIAASDIASAVPVNVTVSTPLPGGGESDPQSFTINSPAQASGARVAPATTPDAIDFPAPNRPSESTTPAIPTVAVVSRASSTPSPAAVIVGLQPAFVVAGSGTLTVSVRGENFTGDSVVRLKGKDLPTKFISETELEVELPAAALAQPGELTLTVFTPGPNGGSSKPATLTVQ